MNVYNYSCFYENTHKTISVFRDVHFQTCLNINYTYSYICLLSTIFHSFFALTSQLFANLWEVNQTSQSTMYPHIYVRFYPMSSFYIIRLINNISYMKPHSFAWFLFVRQVFISNLDSLSWESQKDFSYWFKFFEMQCISIYISYSFVEVLKYVIHKQRTPF